MAHEDAISEKQGSIAGSVTNHFGVSRQLTDAIKRRV